MAEISTEPGVVTVVAAFTNPLFTVASDGTEEFHVARLVTLRVLPLVSVAVAVYCRLVPCARFVVVGVIAIDTTDGGTTVAVVLPLMVVVGSVAVIVTGLVVVPTPVAAPLTVIVILVVSDELHVTVPVMSCIVVTVPFMKVPVAVNWSGGVWYTRTGLIGVTAIDTKCADVTVNVTEGLVIEPDVAVIEVGPGVRPNASPCVPCELLMVATF